MRVRSLVGRGWLWRMERFQIGLREGWGGAVPLTLSCMDRRRHVFVIGQTGTGKSTLLQQLLAQDIEAGNGCALIDPHGDLAHAVLDAVPPHRVDDVVVVNPTDAERPVALNPFYRVPVDERALVASNLTAAFKHIWRDSWGPRLEYILYNTVAALLDAPDSLRPSFLAIPLVLVRQDYRERVIRHIQDPRVRGFFVDEFCGWNERQLAEYLSPAQNKIGQFLANPFVRNIVGQWKPTVDLSAIMEKGHILIAPLSKGTLGEEPANLLGSMIVSGLQHAAMRRASMPEAKRADFHLFVDEFHNFTTDAFASMLSEVRKYGLTLTVAGQYLSQAPDDVRDAIFGNVGTIISFRVSADDADRLTKEIGDYSARTLRELSLGEICVRLTQAGQGSAAFVGRTVPETTPAHRHRANVLNQSRMRFGRDRANTETRMARWLRREV